MIKSSSNKEPVKYELEIVTEQFARGLEQLDLICFLQFQRRMQRDGVHGRACRAEGHRLLHSIETQENDETVLVVRILQCLKGELVDSRLERCKNAGNEVEGSA